MSRSPRVTSTLLLAVCLTVAGVLPGGRSVAAANAPDPTTLLQQSIAAMKGSVTSAHTAGKDSMTANKQKAALTFSGKCALSGERLSALLTLKGTTIGDKAPAALNEQDGLVWVKSPGWVAVFTRPAGANQSWRSIDPFDSTGAQLFNTGCPLILVTQLEQQPLVSLTLVGPATIGTESTWHLRSTVAVGRGSQTVHLYIDQQSLFLLRFTVTTNTPQVKQSATINYSAFNDPVSITLPAVDARTNRALHSAVRLPDGRVMVMGGVSVGTDKAITFNGWADLYDPSAGIWSRISGLPSVPVQPSLSVTGDGRVLINGYYYPAGVGLKIFDPTSNAWTTAPQSLVSRTYPVSVVLKDGRLLVAGGYNMTAGSAEKSAEIYNPATGTWSKTGSLNEPRMTGTLTALLKNGRVLVISGSGMGSASAEIYNPVKGTWTMVDVPALPGVTALWTLPSGTVLVIGPGPGGPLSTTIYDPTKDRYSVVRGSPVKASSWASVLLKNGKLLVAGGASTASAGPQRVLTTAWLFDPTSGRWSTTGSMKHARMMDTLTLLANGKVLAAGGFSSMSNNGPSNPVSTAEIYDPATGTWSPTGSMK